MDLQRIDYWQIGKFRFDERGVTVLATPTYDEWAATLEKLRLAHGALQLWIGDIINLGEAYFGELAAQVIDAEGWALESVRNYRWVASKVPVENRRPRLSFTHHQAVAELPPAEQREWLERAEEGDDQGVWTSGRLKHELAAAKGKESKMHYRLLVECRSESDLQELTTTMEREGRSCRRIISAKSTQPKRPSSTRSRQKAKTRQVA